MMLFVALFVIVNTIRIAVHGRRDEIEIMQLVGASDWFVRWPFILEGMLVGALGAVAALSIVFAASGPVTGAMIDFLVTLPISLGPEFAFQLAASVLGVALAGRRRRGDAVRARPPREMTPASRLDQPAVRGGTMRPWMLPGKSGEVGGGRAGCARPSSRWWASPSSSVSRSPPPPTIRSRKRCGARKPSRAPSRSRARTPSATSRPRTSSRPPSTRRTRASRTWLRSSAAAQSEAESLGYEIQITEEQLALVAFQLDETKALAESLTAQAAEQQRQLVQREDLYAKHLVATYRQALISPLEMLLSSRTLTEFANRVQQMIFVNRQDQQLANEIRGLRAGHRCEARATRPESRTRSSVSRIRSRRSARASRSRSRSTSSSSRRCRARSSSRRTRAPTRRRTKHRPSARSAPRTARPRISTGSSRRPSGSTRTSPRSSPPGAASVRSTARSSRCGR